MSSQAEFEHQFVEDAKVAFADYEANMRAEGQEVTTERAYLAGALWMAAKLTLPNWKHKPAPKRR